MAHDLRAAIDELAQALQPIALLSTRLRQTLGELNEDAVALEAAADRAMKIIRRLQPTSSE